jgi:hypothetical protein
MRNFILKTMRRENKGLTPKKWLGIIILPTTFGSFYNIRSNDTFIMPANYRKLLVIQYPKHMEFSCN